MMVFVDTTEITDWQFFHQIFSQIFGFPTFYGNNMDAFIDCLSYFDEPQAEMTRRTCYARRNVGDTA